MPRKAKEKLADVSDEALRDTYAWLCDSLNQVNETPEETARRRENERRDKEFFQRQEARGPGRRDEKAAAAAADPPANKLDYNTTLETFMENFCEPLRPELIKRCAKQLRDAHKNKTCLLPQYVGKPKKGQRHAYNSAELMKAWPRLRDHLPELPPLKPLRSNTISTGK
jgi:hypothetical protein